jgi:ubiquinone/menaquinone biosynthesis C-methylase UbiE
MIKRSIKNILLHLRLGRVFDTCLFWYSRVVNYIPNLIFRRKNPSFVLPPDYFLHETFQLKYDLYKRDGEHSAAELIEWATKYKPDIVNILDWGCGVARITRHLSGNFNSNVNVTGIDINAQMVEWNKSNIPGVEFREIQYCPPTGLPNSYYDLVIGVSVFTHIECSHHESWLEEISRILQEGGLFIFTTHGEHFYNKLNTQEFKKLLKHGCFTQAYEQAGHRMMSTYMVADEFRKKLAPCFDVLEFHAGHLDLSKTGGQDLWILRKRLRHEI